MKLTITELDEAIATLRHGVEFDPLATLACCLAAVLWYRRHESETLPLALRVYAVVAAACATP